MKGKNSSDKNELVRKILQVCAGCSRGSRGKGRGLVCESYPGRCPSKKVKQWVKKIEELEKSKSKGK
jgi:hypothetical protein